jgi:hypothetical protein
MMNESSEYLTYFPEWAGLHRHISSKYGEFCVRVEQTHQQVTASLTTTDGHGAYLAAIQNYAYKEYLLAIREGTSVFSTTQPPLCSHLSA